MLVVAIMTITALELQGLKKKLSAMNGLMDLWYMGLTQTIVPLTNLTMQMATSIMIFTRKKQDWCASMQAT